MNKVSTIAIYMSLMFSMLATPSSSLAAHQVVRLPAKAAAQFQPGTVVIRARERHLYLVLNGGKALRYPVAVPKRGREWSGYAHVINMQRWPAWAPPDVVRRNHPELPDYIPSGDPRNPVGAAAIMLDRGQAAIHGTSPKMRKSIGTAASYGCIRMYNEDVVDLYDRIGIGTLVVMIN